MLIRTFVLGAVAICGVAASATPSDARVIRHQGRYIWVNPASRVALNPQPLPPRWILGNRINSVTLNPQPLPPRWTLGNRINRVTLNPQPLPPRAIYRYR